ncbi:hypothetical protein JT359_15930 [Candidatus Poribacteria bacterium]|nr:hypothetical protein [Candidatus Poribacteria bacterium]
MNQLYQYTFRPSGACLVVYNRFLQTFRLSGAMLGLSEFIFLRVGLRVNRGENPETL